MLRRLMAAWAIAVGVLLQPLSASAAAAILVTNVTVLPMDGGDALPAHEVLVEGDRIAAVGPNGSLEAPADAVRIDGAGGYLMPGIGDMHVHIPKVENTALLDDMLTLFVAKGVTTVRSMWGLPGQLELRDAILAENRLAPRLILAGPGFAGEKWTPATARAEVERQAAAGWDLIKVHWGLSPDVYDAILSAAAEHDLEVSGHVPTPDMMSAVLAGNQRTLEHLDGYIAYLDGLGGPIPDERLTEIAQQTKAAGIAIVPTMHNWQVFLRAVAANQLAQMSELAYMPPAMAQRWYERQSTSLWGLAQAWLRSVTGERRITEIVDNRRRLLRALVDAEVEILFGTDAIQPFTIPGFSVIREMRAMREVGMENRPILISATANVSGYLASHGVKAGRIVPGMSADMILLADSPARDLEALAEPAGVMLRGRWLDASLLRERLAAIQRRHAGAGN